MNETHANSQYKCYIMVVVSVCLEQSLKQSRSATVYITKVLQ